MRAGKVADNVQSFNNVAAGETALVLLVFSFVVLSLVYALNRRMWKVFPAK